MPGGMDGIETMMEIHRVRLDASVIIITAYATVDTAIQAMKEGAQEYIRALQPAGDLLGCWFHGFEVEEAAEGECDSAKEAESPISAP